MQIEKIFRRIEPAEFLIAFSTGFICAVAFVTWLLEQDFADNHNSDARNKANRISENH